MIIKDFYKFLQQNVNSTDKIHPHTSEAWEENDVILYSLERTQYHYTHDGDDTCHVAHFRLVHINRTPNGAIDMAEETELLLRDFRDFLQPGGTKVDRVEFLDTYSIFDTQIVRYGMVHEIEISYYRT